MSTCILLATCNGARYLRQMLSSLETQTVESWQALVRDDASTDGTPALLAEAAAADPRIRLVHDSLGRQGPAQNFGLLMRAALAGDAAHYAFADQDDVWRPDKLARQLERMRQAEREVGRDVPLLIHSDLTVVDETLATRQPSFMRWSDLPCGNRITAAGMLVCNSVVGCTMLANRRLIEMACPVPREMVMHDWWLGLLAMTCGRLLYDEAPMVLYRQHANNEIGATTFRQKLRAAWRGWRPVWERALGNFRDGVAQARALRDRLRERQGGHDAPMLSLVDDYCRLFDGAHPGPARLWKLHRLGVRLPGHLRQATILARALALPSPTEHSPCAASRTGRPGEARGAGERP